MTVKDCRSNDRRCDKCGAKHQTELSDTKLSSTNTEPVSTVPVHSDSNMHVGSGSQGLNI